MLDRIVAVADLTTWARSGVERDTWATREILAVPEPEQPARFAKALAALFGALIAMGYDERGAGMVVTRVAADSIPPTRRAVLATLHADGERSGPEIADDIGLPTTTTTRTLEDLAALKLVQRSAGTGGPGAGHRWTLSEPGAELWTAMAEMAEVSECHPKSRDGSEKAAPSSLSLPLGSD
jgi:DNA-binding MarR family transcriptional regulator